MEKEMTSEEINELKKRVKEDIENLIKKQKQQKNEKLEEQREETPTREYFKKVELQQTESKAKANRFLRKFLEEIEYANLSEDKKIVIDKFIRIGHFDFEELVINFTKIKKELQLNVDIDKIIDVVTNTIEEEKEERNITKARTSFYDENYDVFVDMIRKVQPYTYDEAGIWWVWNKKDRCWKMKDETGIICIFYMYVCLTDIFFSKTKTAILNAAKTIGRLNPPKKAKTTWIQFKNVIVDVETLEKIKIESKWFITNPIPWNFVDDINTPTFDRLFSEWVGEKNKQVLYEIMSYCILPDYPLHIGFILIGSGSNGKSLCLHILENLIGQYNVTSGELELLMLNQFEAAKLYKKLAVLMGETNFNTIQNTSIIKRLTGNDLISFNFKYKNPFEARNYAKLIIATNSLPMTLDKSIGFYRRWLIVNFPNYFTSKRDILAEIPEEEYHRLASKCIYVLHELLKKKEFTNEGTIEEKKQRFEDASNPLDRFLRETTKFDSDGHIFKWIFKERFFTWQRDNGYRIWTEKELGLRLKEKFEDGRRETKKDEYGNPVYYHAWLGLNWKTKINDFEVSMSGMSALSGLYKDPYTDSPSFQNPDNADNADIKPKNSINMYTNMDNTTQHVSNFSRIFPMEHVEHPIIHILSYYLNDRKTNPVAIEQLFSTIRDQYGVDLSQEWLESELMRLKEEGIVTEPRAGYVQLLGK